jgi:PAS domain S-box-containing protein
MNNSEYDEQENRPQHVGEWDRPDSIAGRENSKPPDRGRAESGMTTRLPTSSALLDLGSRAYLIELFPMAAYAVRAPDGVIAWFNSRAAELWGRVPAVDDTDERFCGSYKLYHADGTPMAHCDTPVALALRTGASVHEEDVVIERSDGSRVTVSVHIDPIRDKDGAIVGVVNFFHDISERKQAERTAGLLAAIVDFSEDAIVSENLDGTILSWNRGSESLFGYAAGEAVGQNITLIVPPDRRDEEATILERLARGERVEHFETVRMRKDGTRLDISLTISPVKDAKGRIVGASKVARDITQHKRAERAQTEQARLLDLSNDAIFVRDAADRVTYWNKAAWELYGYTREEALGRVTHELMHTEFPEPLESINEQLHRDDRWTGELIHRKKDGTQITVVSRWALDRDAQGNPRSILETNNDITQQKRTEKALRESEERFRAIVETTPECVNLVAADGTLLHMNPSGLKMVGADSTDLVVGKSVYDLIAPKDQDRFRAFNERICRGERDSLEFDIVGLRGALRHMDTHGAPLRNSDGEVIQLAVTRDITDRKQAEEAQYRLAAIVESSDDAIVSKNLDGIITSWNSGAQRIFGYTPQEAIGQSIGIIIPAELREEERQILNRLRKGGRVDHFETVRLNKSGARLHVSLTISPVRNSRGEIIGASKVARDVTQRWQAEVARENEFSARLLRVQDEERRRLARELHDGVGQLLAAMSINASRVNGQKSKLSPETARCAEENAKLIEQVSADIRTVSYLLHPPLLDEMGLHSALKWYVDGFAERSKISTQLELPADSERLPQYHELCLFRIAQECLTNIHRHSGSMTARVRLVRTPREIKLEVSDEGKGFNQETKGKIASGETAGVGLRGMRERLKQLGGSVEIDSNGNGTTVTATVPFAESQDGHANQSAT